MPIPDSWAKISERLQYTTERGWEIVEVWTGPAGASKATRASWLANFTGYTSLVFEDDLPRDDGDCKVRATISFASNASGDTVLPGGDDYGLLSRTWTLLGSDEQLPIEAHEKVAALQNAYEPWPQTIRAYVESYRTQTKQAIEAWGFASNSSPALPDWELPHPVTDATLRGYAENYASLLLNQDNPSFERARYVLRKVETVTSWSTMVVSHTNVNRWLRWSTLTASEPTLASTGLIQTASLTSYIWLKKAPEVTVSSNGSRELTQEFWGGINPAAGTSAKSQLEFIFGTIL